MKHTIDVAAEGCCHFTVTTRGRGSAEGIKAFLDDIVNHPRWQAGSNILLDHRKLDIADITVDGIDQVSHYFRKIGPHLGHGKIALVMNKDIDFGIARAWEMVTDGHVDMKIGVFRTVEEAQSWLNATV